MSQLISAVADMTGQRDRDLLEVTMAEVLFALLEVRRLALWKVIPHNHGARMRLMAGLESGQVVAMSDPAVEPEMLPCIDQFDGFPACFDSQMPVRMTVRETGVRRHVYPITSEREAVGLLEVEADNDLTEAQDVVVAGLLRIYRNHLSLLDYSEHDTLTGLLNRRAFDDIFNRRVSRQGMAMYADRAIEFIGHRRVSLPGESAWLLIVDVDFFKRVNDRFGHLFGDEVLLLMARFMRSVFRPNDVLFRFGGEEFVVLLAPTDALGAEAAAERYRTAVENFPFPQIGRMTVCIGYTKVGVGDAPFDAFGRADEALYYAKQHGRNRALCYDTLVRKGLIRPKQEIDSDVHMF